MNDLNKLLEVLPREVAKRVPKDRIGLIELVLDIGRELEARYIDGIEYLGIPITQTHIEHILRKVSRFGPDNRAGIEGTLHRISRVIARNGETVGLTCRCGLPFIGSVDIISDLLREGKNILLVGAPGAGKSTRLRDIARFLSSEQGKRVLIVDTSNEIAGEGITPHPAVGKSRRMQVPFGKTQHEIMIEAVENHTPEVIIIDEISTIEEAKASRTIAQRGVQLIATCHGQYINDVINNPPLWSCIGGVKTVTLSDLEAKKGGRSKTVQEREYAPVFDVIVEIKSFTRLGIHRDCAKAVDAILSGDLVYPEIRSINDGKTETTTAGRIVKVKKNVDATIL